MNEVSGEQVKAALREGTVLPLMDALYVYSPLCGTCRLAERLLEVVNESLPDCRLMKLNIMLHPDLAAQLRIKSVPCVIKWHSSDPEKQSKYIYAMHSVTHLYEELQGRFDQ